MTYPPPDPEYLGPAAHTSGPGNKPIERVVIHSTVSACIPGGRYAVARYFRSPAAGGSAHYITDPSGEAQVVYDSVIAWHAPPNPRSAGIEMCDIPGPVPDDPPGSARRKAARRSWRWILPNQRRMLRRTALLTAELCLANDVPVTWLTAAELRAGQHGITSHANVSEAFHQTTHWDPGWWPRRTFMKQTRRYAREIKAGTPADVIRKDIA
jgi:hypothetical protein